IIEICDRSESVSVTAAMTACVAVCACCSFESNCFWTLARNSSASNSSGFSSGSLRYSPIPLGSWAASFAASPSVCRVARTVRTASMAPRVVSAVSYLPRWRIRSVSSSVFIPCLLFSALQCTVALCCCMWCRAQLPLRPTGDVLTLWFLWDCVDNFVHIAEFFFWQSSQCLERLLIGSTRLCVFNQGVFCRGELHTL